MIKSESELFDEILAAATSRVVKADKGVQQRERGFDKRRAALGRIELSVVQTISKLELTPVISSDMLKGGSWRKQSSNGEAVPDKMSCKLSKGPNDLWELSW